MFFSENTKPYQTTFDSTTLAVRFFFYRRAKWKWEAWSPAGIVCKIDPKKRPRNMSAEPALGHKWMSSYIHLGMSKILWYPTIQSPLHDFSPLPGVPGFNPANHLNSRCPILVPEICFHFTIVPLKWRHWWQNPMLIQQFIESQLINPIPLFWAILWSQFCGRFPLWFLRGGVSYWGIESLNPNRIPIESPLNHIKSPLDHHQITMESPLNHQVQYHWCLALRFWQASKEDAAQQGGLKIGSRNKTPGYVSDK